MLQKGHSLVGQNLTMAVQKQDWIKKSNYGNIAVVPHYFNYKKFTSTFLAWNHLPE